MNRLMLIVAGVLLIASGAITAAIGLAQWNSEDSVDQQAAKLCKSDETVVRTTRINPDEGGLMTVYYCQNEDNVRREIEVTEDDRETSIGLGVMIAGGVMAAIGLVVLTVGLVRKSPSAPGHEFTPMPMTVTTLPGGGTVMSSNVVMLNGQQVDPNSDMALMIQQAFGAMNMAFNQMDQGAGLDVGGLLQMALQQLDAARAAGTISEDDYQQAREKIMKNMG
ncbi:MAG: hypothetical protein K8L91_02750 [Anaerolineae bacterium]|nr:hypothetical protein [Anaerolineae bacterium]